MQSHCLVTMAQVCEELSLQQGWAECFAAKLAGTSFTKLYLH